MVYEEHIVENFLRVGWTHEKDVQRIGRCLSFKK